ncbi:MAG: AMP-binding protein, partial [Deltaproteobacteria bacterium]|nr:AMP-binding protein [Deltaproteobacteria bacterium]
MGLSVTNPLWLAHWPEGVPKSVRYPDIPVQGILSHAVSAYREKIAAVHEGRNFTYEQLDDYSSRLANALSDLGVRKGDRVIVYLRNSPEFIVSYYGILKAGGVV